MTSPAHIGAAHGVGLGIVSSLQTDLRRVNAWTLADKKERRWSYRCRRAARFATAMTIIDFGPYVYGPVFNNTFQIEDNAYV